MARVSYARSEFREALRILWTIEFTDIYYHLYAKVLILKIYFETEDFEPLLALIFSTRIYFSRSKLICDYQRKIYIYFLNYI